MTRLTIVRFDVVRTANIVAALYAVVVLVVGLLFLVPLAIIGGAAFDQYGGEAAAGVGGALALGAMAVVFYGIIGWVMTAIVCALYNVIAGRIGGMRIEVQVEVPVVAQAPAGWAPTGESTPQSGQVPPGQLPPPGTPPAGRGAPGA
jgi:hypothetical protein